MEYRRFGKTELPLPVVSLGGMRFPHGWDQPHDEIPDDTLAAAIATTRHALSVGINHIETARGYGKSERVYGMALRELKPPREDIIITTKIGPTETAAEMNAAIDESLERLGIDYIDNFDIHGINNDAHLERVFRLGGCLEAIEDARKDGRIRHLGFSTHGSLAVILKAIETNVFESVNLHFYYFFQRNLAAIYLAASKDMGVFIISPNDKGGHLFNPSECLTELCAPLHPMHFNGRFCLSYPEIHTLSLGASTPEEIDAYLPMLNDGYYLTPEDRAIKAKMDAQVLTLGAEYCSLCQACLPCPEKINIPEVLRFRNMDAAYDMRAFGEYRYNMFSIDDHWFGGAFADACTTCGDCLPRCPEKLDIPSLLRDTHARLHVPKKS